MPAIRFNTNGRDAMQMDQQKIEALATKLFGSTNEYMMGHASDRVTIFEVMQALAFVVATIVMVDSTAHAWFEDALDIAVESLQADKREGRGLWG